MDMGVRVCVCLIQVAGALGAPSVRKLNTANSPAPLRPRDWAAVGLLPRASFQTPVRSTIMSAVTFPSADEKSTTSSELPLPKPKPQPSKYDATTAPAASNVKAFSPLHTTR